MYFYRITYYFNVVSHVSPEILPLIMKIYLLFNSIGAHTSLSVLLNLVYNVLSCALNYKDGINCCERGLTLLIGYLFREGCNYGENDFINFSCRSSGED